MTPSTETAPPPAPAPEASTAVAEAPAYALDVDDWEGPVGEEGYVTVAVVAQGDHKINVEYPQRISLDAPPKGLALPVRKLSMDEGQLESEKRLVFTVPATPTEVGAYQLRGTVRLSVCSDAQCKTVKEPVQARIVAQ